MCLTSCVEIVDKVENLCANCFPVYYRYRKGSADSPQNQTELKCTMEDLKKKWNRR